MTDWMDDAWQDFLDNEIQSKQDYLTLKLMKKAWLAGGRAAVVHVRSLVDEHSGLTRGLEESPGPEGDGRAGTPRTTPPVNPLPR